MGEGPGICFHRSQSSKEFQERKMDQQIFPKHQRLPKYKGLNKCPLDLAFGIIYKIKLQNFSRRKDWIFLEERLREIFPPYFLSTFLKLHVDLGVYGVVRLSHCLQFIKKNTLSAKHNKIKCNKMRYVCNLFLGFSSLHRDGAIDRLECPQPIIYS